MSMEYCSDFKYDLKLGNEAEKKIMTHIMGSEISKIEIKNDFKTLYTGNIYIEYESRGKPSGVYTTESDIYIYNIEYSPVKLFFYVEDLRRLVNHYKSTHTVIGGDNNTSKGILISVQEVVKFNNRLVKLKEKKGTE